MDKQFLHECDRCRYLGPYTSDWYGPNRRYELYACETRDPSVLARYGDKAHEYASGPAACFEEDQISVGPDGEQRINTNSPLREAWRRSFGRIDAETGV